MTGDLHHRCSDIAAAWRGKAPADLTPDDVESITPDEVAELKSIAENGDGAVSEGALSHKSGSRRTSTTGPGTTTDTQATGVAVTNQSNSTPANVT